MRRPLPVTARGTRAASLAPAAIAALALLLLALAAPPSAAAAQTSLTFALWGDTNPGSMTATSAAPEFKRVASSLGQRSYSFSVATGDYVPLGSTDSRTTMEAKYNAFLSAASPIRKAPVYYAPGNHELINSSSTARSVYHAKLGVPSTDWYQVQNGSLHILMLSAVEPGRTLGTIGYYGETSTSNSYQARWLVSTLKSIAAADRAAWVLIAVHYPMHDANSGDPWRSSTGERPRLEALFEKYGVDGVLNGHVHYYRRHVAPDRITYLTQGTAGSPSKSTTSIPLDGYDRAAVGSVFGYTLLTRGSDNTLRGVTYEASSSTWSFTLRDSFSFTNRTAQ